MNKWMEDWGAERFNKPEVKVYVKDENHQEPRAHDAAFIATMLNEMMQYQQSCIKNNQRSSVQGFTLWLQTVISEEQTELETKYKGL